MMKSDENPLDALRDGWSLYGERLDKALDDCPQPELRFRYGGRRPMWTLAAVLTVTWLLLTGAAILRVPETEGHAMAGTLSMKPAMAVNCVHSILEAV